MNYFLVFSLMSMMIFAGCSSPKVRENYVTFKTLNSEVDQVEIMEEQFPEGIFAEGQSIRVKDGFKDKIELLGRIEIELKLGHSPTLLYHSQRDAQGGGMFYDTEKAGFLQNYCMYNPLNGLPFPIILNYLNPLAWPCFGFDTYASDSDDDIAYRKNVIIERLKRIAKKKGANHVVGVKFTGKSIISLNTSATLSNSSHWYGTGYAINIK